MIIIVPSSSLLGVDGHPVAVEVHVGNGLPMFNLVGLPDVACREARDRVRAALLSSGVAWLMQRITVNLAPSNVRKVGGGLDLAIAVGLLVAAGRITPESIEGVAFLGELSLDGSVRSVKGIVPLVDAVNTSAVVVPEDCIRHASVLGKHTVFGVRSLCHLIEALNGDASWSTNSRVRSDVVSKPEPDISDVRGQPLARWALEVAAAGGHNIILTGAPGSGKTMLARRLPSLLPDLDVPTALTTTKIHSAVGLLSFDDGLLVRPPFRAPHHTASTAALVGGGGAIIRPGEASVSHGGVLFLDEVPEFSSSTLDALREPLEDGVVRIARANGTAKLPARFMCVAAMNPCPCGEGLSAGACRCPTSTAQRYMARISGPLLDRFDLRILVRRPKIDHLLALDQGEPSATVAERVVHARSLARRRGVNCNAELDGAALTDASTMDRFALAVLRKHLQRGTLTARGLDRVRRVALTLADLDGGSAVLTDQHVCAALELRADVIAKEESAS